MAHIDLETVIGEQAYIVYENIIHAQLEPVLYGKDAYFKITKARILKNNKFEIIDAKGTDCDIYLGIKNHYNELKILSLSEEAMANIEDNMPSDVDESNKYIEKIVENLIEDASVIITGDTKAITKYKLKI